MKLAFGYEAISGAASIHHGLSLTTVHDPRYRCHAVVPLAGFAAKRASDAKLESFGIPHLHVLLRLPSKVPIAACMEVVPVFRLPTTKTLRSADVLRNGTLLHDWSVS